MIKKWFRFFAARPIISVLIIFALLAASYAVVSVLSFVIPMSLGLLVATIVTFPILSAIILVLVVILSLLLKFFSRKSKISND